METQTHRQPEAPIFIMGYMACGKTTFGKALARALGRDFIDLDFRIEQRFHTSISELFRTRGEDGFRRLETMMLQEVSAMENVVIACGGGTPCFNDNMELMRASGLTVWLQATPERIVQRLTINRARRPLMADKRPDELMQAVTDGLNARTCHYSRAHICFDGEYLEDSRQIDNTVRTFVKEYGSFFLGKKQLNS